MKRSLTSCRGQPKASSCGGGPELLGMQFSESTWFSLVYTLLEKLTNDALA